LFLGQLEPHPHEEKRQEEKVPMNSLPFVPQSQETENRGRHAPHEEGERGKLRLDVDFLESIVQIDAGGSENILPKHRGRQNQQVQKIETERLMNGAVVRLLPSHQIENEIRPAVLGIPPPVLVKKRRRPQRAQDQP